MGAVAAREPQAAVGRAKPRIGPPVPARSGWKEFADFAAGVGIDLFPWQRHVARYLTAKGIGDRWLYREVAVIVARQNGKTTMLVPLIIQRLLAGQSIMHTAQNAKLPREVHEEVADRLQAHYPDRLPSKRAISYAVGHESIKVVGGGKYRIVAPTKGGARGPSNDLVIVDELREMGDFDFIAAAKPTLTASSTPQMLYLSNAGSDASAVLNSLRDRKDEDPVLAYLEWSAAPGRRDDDFAGWLESNPSIGHIPAVLETLTSEHRTNRLANTLGIFETEHLCRWVPTDFDPLVSLELWKAGHMAKLGVPRRPYMGIAVDPEGTRASAAMAWRRPDGSFAVTMLEHGSGSPVDPDLFGERLRELAKNNRILTTGFDPLTDASASKFLVRPKSIAGREFANATSMFVNLTELGRLHWSGVPAVTEDLAYTTRKEHDESGSFTAVRAKDDVPITAVLAAIRAVWLAAEPRQGKARIY